MERNEEEERNSIKLLMQFGERVISPFFNFVDGGTILPLQIYILFFQNGG